MCVLFCSSKQGLFLKPVPGLAVPHMSPCGEMSQAARSPGGQVAGGSSSGAYENAFLEPLNAVLYVCVRALLCVRVCVRVPLFPPQPYLQLPSLRWPSMFVCVFVCILG